MIVEALRPYRIGEIVDLGEYEQGPTSVTKARIMRVATEQEYVDDCLNDPTCPEETKSVTKVENRAGRWWYEVAPD